MIQQIADNPTQKELDVIAVIRPGEKHYVIDRITNKLIRVIRYEDKKVI